MTKKNTLFLLLTAGAGWLGLTSYSSGPGQSLGDGSGTGCSGSGCHGAASSATGISLQFTDDNTSQVVTDGKYIPGRVYTVRLTGTQANAGLTHFGFQTTARRGNGANAGTLAVLNSSTTHTYNASGRLGVEHSAPIARTSGNFIVSFRWTAPPSGQGDATFHTALNAVNRNFTADNGDIPNIGTTVLNENTTASVPAVSLASDLSLYPNPAKDRLTVDVRGWQRGSYAIALTSIMGSVVFEQKAEVGSGDDKVEIELPALPAGAYGLRVQGPMGSHAAPVIIR